jgi:hypothetical protein
MVRSGAVQSNDVQKAEWHQSPPHNDAVTAAVLQIVEQQPVVEPHGA